MSINSILRSHCVPGSKILGVGGPSHHLYKLNIPNVKVYDLNISDRDYNKNQGRGKKHYSDCLIIGDIMKAPFSDNTFDACFSSNTLEHINEPWVAVEECVRVTKENGLIVLFTPFSWKYHDKPDYYRFSSEGLTYLFERTDKMKTIESKMIKHNKKKPRGWADFWRAIYYGIKKPSTNV